MKIPAGHTQEYVGPCEFYKLLRSYKTHRIDGGNAAVYATIYTLDCKWTQELEDHHMMTMRRIAIEKLNLTDLDVTE